MASSKQRPAGAGASAPPWSIAWPQMVGALGAAILAALACWQCRMAVSNPAGDWLSLYEPVEALLWPPGVRWFCVGWFTVMGGAFGSFLNVVVYRLPLGLNLSVPPSHCPRCKHAIRWRDNVPVLGWLLLRGKCRDCGQPISTRYPLVEFAAALIALALACLALIFAEPTLPPRAAWIAGPVTHLRQEGDLLLMTVAYSSLLLTLLAAALIEHDGHRPPWRLWPTCCVFGAALSFWPGSKPPSLWAAGPEVLLSPGVELAAGAFASVLAAMIFWRRDAGAKWPPAGPKMRATLPEAGAVLSAALTLGWMEGLLLGALAAIAGRLCARPHAAFLTLVVAWLLVWRWAAWRLEQNYAWPTVAMLGAALVLALQSRPTPPAASEAWRP